MAQGFRRKWKNFFRIPAVKITTKVFSTIFKCILTIFLIGVITASMVGCVLVVYVVTSFDVSESVPDLDSISLHQSSSILVKDQATGEFVEHQRVEGSKMVWKDLDQIPINLRYAVISIEDERFEDHYGVDWKRTISAFVNLIFHFSSQEYGGSTITQQLIKIITEDDRHSIERKISEIFQAIELERQCSKEQILELYLNSVYLSRGCYGVQAASYKYFSKSVSELSLDEAAWLASIIQSPSRYDPISKPENNKMRRQEVYNRMLSEGAITQAEYDEVYTIDLSKLRPTVAFPHLPENTKTIDEAGEIAIDQVVIGSCTNGRLNDMKIAAEILRGKQVHPKVRTIVIPATQQIYLDCIRLGYVEDIVKAGAIFSTPTCGPCLGGHMGILAAGERCVSTTNRNFVGRMGHTESEVYLASPAVAAASAIAGYIADPEKIAGGME